MFQSIESPRTSVTKCVDAIRRSILSGDLAPGARLPPERGLAQDFGVNRVTLRSALAQLTAVGLVSVRQGSGYVVQNFTRRGGPDLLPGVIELALEAGTLGEVVADLLLLRRHMARAMLERIFEVADAQDVQRVHEAVEAFAALAANDPRPAEVAEADLAVVAALLDATHSRVMQLCINPVVAVVARLTNLQAVIYAEPQTNVAGWRLLVDALRKGDSSVSERLISILEERDGVALAALGAAS